MTERDEDGGVGHTTLWHGTLAGGMAVDEDGGEDGGEYDNEYGGENKNDSHLDMEMRTRTILIGPPPGSRTCARQKSWAGSP